MSFLETCICLSHDQGISHLIYLPLRYIYFYSNWSFILSSALMTSFLLWFFFFFLLSKTEKLYTVSKNKTGSWLCLRSWLLIAKFRLKLNKVGKTTRPFRYDLNQILYDYTVEVRNRFKGLNLIDRLPDELWTEVHDIVQETGIKTIPKKKKWVAKVLQFHLQHQSFQWTPRTDLL